MAFSQNGIMIKTSLCSSTQVISFEQKTATQMITHTYTAFSLASKSTGNCFLLQLCDSFFCNTGSSISRSSKYSFDPGLSPLMGCQVTPQLRIQYRKWFAVGNVQPGHSQFGKQ